MVKKTVAFSDFKFWKSHWKQQIPYVKNHSIKQGEGTPFI